MPVSDETLTSARKGDRRAVEAVLLDSFPAVYRMAHGLTGRQSAAARVIRLVLQRGVRVLPTWRPGILPENWFYHHTILTARSANAEARDVPDAQRDLLVSSARSDGASARVCATLAPPSCG